MAEPAGEEPIPAPPEKLEVDFAYGYSGSVRNNLYTVSSREVLYCINGVAVVLDIESNSQRCFNVHTGRITCIDYNAATGYVATGQDAPLPPLPPGVAHQSFISLWRVGGCGEAARLFVEDPVVEACCFAHDASTLYAVVTPDVSTPADNRVGVLYAWELEGLDRGDPPRSVLSAVVSDRPVLGITAHPTDASQVVVYGHQLLKAMLWNRDDEGEQLDQTNASWGGMDLSKRVAGAGDGKGPPIVTEAKAGERGGIPPNIITCCRFLYDEEVRSALQGRPSKKQKTTTAAAEQPAPAAAAAAAAAASGSSGADEGKGSTRVSSTVAAATSEGTVVILRDMIAMCVIELPTRGLALSFVLPDDEGGYVCGGDDGKIYFLDPDHNTAAEPIECTLDGEGVQIRTCIFPSRPSIVIGTVSGDLCVVHPSSSSDLALPGPASHEPSDTGRLLRLVPSPGPVCAIAAHPYRNSEIAVGAQSIVKFIDVEHHAELPRRPYRVSLASGASNSSLGSATGTRTGPPAAAAASSSGDGGGPPVVVTCLAYHLTGVLLAIGTSKGGLHFVATPDCGFGTPIQDCNRLCRERVGSWSIGDMGFTPSGEFIAATSASSPEAAIYHVVVQLRGDMPYLRVEKRCSLQGGPSPFHELQFSEDSSLLMITDKSKNIMWWRVPEGARLDTMQGDDLGVIQSAIWFSDSHTWKPITGFLVGGIMAESSGGQYLGMASSAIVSCESARRHQLLAAGTTCGRVRLFHFPCPAMADCHEHWGHAAAISSVKWTQDDTLITSGGKDNCIIQWRIIDPEAARPAPPAIEEPSTAAAAAAAAAQRSPLAPSSNQAEAEYEEALTVDDDDLEVLRLRMNGAGAKPGVRPPPGPGHGPPFRGPPMMMPHMRPIYPPPGMQPPQMEEGGVYGAQRARGKRSASPFISCCAPTTGRQPTPIVSRKAGAPQQTGSRGPRPPGFTGPGVPGFVYGRVETVDSDSTDSRISFPLPQPSPYASFRPPPGSPAPFQLHHFAKRPPPPSPFIRPHAPPVGGPQAHVGPRMSDGGVMRPPMPPLGWTMSHGGRPMLPMPQREEGPTQQQQQQQQQETREGEMEQKQRPQTERKGRSATDDESREVAALVTSRYPAHRPLPILPSNGPPGHPPVVGLPQTLTHRPPGPPPPFTPPYIRPLPSRPPPGPPMGPPIRIAPPADFEKEDMGRVERPQQQIGLWNDRLPPSSPPIVSPPRVPLTPTLRPAGVVTPPHLRVAYRYHTKPPESGRGKTLLTLVHPPKPYKKTGEPPSPPDTPIPPMVLESLRRSGDAAADGARLGWLTVPAVLGGGRGDEREGSVQCVGVPSPPPNLAGRVLQPPPGPKASYVTPKFGSPGNQSAQVSPPSAMPEPDRVEAPAGAAEPVVKLGDVSQRLTGTSQQVPSSAPSPPFPPVHGGPPPPPLPHRPLLAPPPLYRPRFASPIHPPMMPPIIPQQQDFLPMPPPVHMAPPYLGHPINLTLTHPPVEGVGRRVQPPMVMMPVPMHRPVLPPPAGGVAPPIFGGGGVGMRTAAGVGVRGGAQQSRGGGMSKCCDVPRGPRYVDGCGL
ncbi:unnamed protein product [Vitrella brassicaformis CCMP3155]|uniref:EML-like second beta-propeller domain-containing protein n=2 Tax=Vitrella brassicaformis TaxID=1169539 RepID=A0A0G4H0U5_VITBC|nr:unnamed protein product [Vitrella brassicaformis CCMP3155]|eukprot:CEM37193.1 unnamed protein product [Vitrella brassicaformis CCMP3155]